LGKFNLGKWALALRDIPLKSQRFLETAATDLLKLLLVEDDAKTAAYLKRALEEAGHEVRHATSGQDGLQLAQTEAHSVIVLDRMLPAMDGLSIVRTLRGLGVQTPVLMLTALGGVEDRVEGLQSGADDYLIKPFAFSELLARVEALARRQPMQGVETRLSVGGIDMDLLRRTVTRDGKPIDLQPREFKLLEYLMRNAGRLVTRRMLLENVWQFNFDPKTNIVESHISRLRAKIGRGYDTEVIRTLRGSGYLMGVD
jgi:two-component system OmpR family response regulator